MYTVGSALFKTRIVAVNIVIFNWQTPDPR